MIIPKITKRKITIRPPNNDEENSVAHVDIHFINGTIALLIGPDILLRLQYENNGQKNKKLKKMKEKILKDKNIFSRDKLRIIRNILVAEQEIRDLLKEDKKELAKKDKSKFDDFIDKLKRRQEILQKLTKKLKIDILKSQSEYLCKNCNAFRPGPDLTQIKKLTCIRCNGLLKRSAIVHVDTDIVKYLTGFWFEEYIANVLTTCGWKVWSSPTLMIHGVSGAPHQIDVLAIKDGRILIVECKTGDFSPTKVRNFLGKYHDIRCHKALAIATGKIHPDGKKIIEKNAAIDYYDNVTSYNKLKSRISKI